MQLVNIKALLLSLALTLAGSAASIAAPVFAAATNRFVINGGDAVSVTNLATEVGAPPLTLT